MKKSLLIMMVTALFMTACSQKQSTDSVAVSPTQKRVLTKEQRAKYVKSPSEESTNNLLGDSMDVIIFDDEEFWYYIDHPEEAGCEDFSFLEMNPSSSFALGCPSWCIPSDFGLTCTAFENKTVYRISHGADLCQQHNGCSCP